MTMLLLGAGTASTSNRHLPFDDIVGTLANPKTLAFLGQMDSLSAARLANVRYNHPNAYYFSSSGNDSTGDGSFDLPFRTIAKAQALVTALGTGGGIHLLFKRGDVFREAPGLTLYSDSVVSAYGNSSSAPIFTGFIHQYNSGGGGWSVHSGNCYKRAENNSIAWVKFATGNDATDLGRPLKRVASAADCVSTADSFAWVSNELFVNIGGTPASTNLEGCIGRGVGYDMELIGDNIRVRGIRLEGWGMRSNAGEVQSYGIATNPNDPTDEVAIEDCDVYYTGYHAIGHLGGSICTIKNCTAGLCRPGPSGGSTVYVTHSPSGGQETIFDGCVTAYGNLWENAYGRVAQSIYGHTSGGEIKFVLVRDHEINVNAWAANAASGFTNVPTAATITDTRVFIINETVDVVDYEPTLPLQAYPMPTDAVHINCFYRSYPTGGTVSTGYLGTGWSINCEYIVTTRTSGYASLFATPGVGNAAGEAFHCRFHSNNYGALFGSGVDSAEWDDLRLRNCILTCEQALQLYSEVAPNAYNDTPANITNNAWFSPDPVVANALVCPTGTSGVGANDDPSKIMLAACPPVSWEPPADSPVGSLGTDYGVEYDATGASRAGDTTHGPYNPIDALVWSIGSVGGGVGVCVVELLSTERYTNTACTTLSLNNGTDTVAGWRNPYGGNWTQATAGNRPTSAARGLQGGGATKYLEGSLAVTDWVIYAELDRDNATDLCFVFGATTGGGAGQCVVLYGTTAYVIDGGSNPIRSVACSQVGARLYRFSAHSGQTFMRGTAFNLAEMVAAGPLSGAGTLTVNRLAARPSNSEGNNSTAYVKNVWVWTGASTFLGSDDERHFLEYVKGLTGKRLL